MAPRKVDTKGLYDLGPRYYTGKPEQHPRPRDRAITGLTLLVRIQAHLKKKSKEKRSKKGRHKNAK